MRNVVTLLPRLLVLPTPRNRAARETVQTNVVRHFRATEGAHQSLRMDFPKRKGARAAKDEVAALLDEIEPRWRRLYVLYPTEDALRGQGRRR